MAILQKFDFKYGSDFDEDEWKSVRKYTFGRNKRKGKPNKLNLHLCNYTLREYFNLPWDASKITFEIHDRPATNRVKIEWSKDEGFEDCPDYWHIITDGEEEILLSTVERTLGKLLKRNNNKPIYAEAYYETSNGNS